MLDLADDQDSFEEEEETDDTENGETNLD